LRSGSIDIDRSPKLPVTGAAILDSKVSRLCGVLWKAER
jgi:hypothetical protein